MTYTAAEITEMREICRRILRSYEAGYSTEKLYPEAEDALRTYIQAEASLDELRAEEKEGVRRRRLALYGMPYDTPGFD